MPSFAYQARDKGGQTVSGTQEAPDQRAAIESLRAAGLYITKLDETRSSGKRDRQRNAVAIGAEPGSATFGGPVVPVSSQAGAAAPPMPPPIAAPLPVFDPPSLNTPSQAQYTASTKPAQKLTGRANAKEMALYFQQMGSMINAGTALSHALNTLGQHSASRALREASSEMSLRVAQGTPWSETMRTYPGLFSELSIGLIAAGEAGGFLDRMCVRLSDYAERDYEIQQSIKRETWYPKLLIFSSILIPSAVPLVLTSMGVQKGNVLLNWLHSVIGPFTLVFLAWAVWKAIDYIAPVTARGGIIRQTIDALKLMVPVAGKAVRGLAVAKFCRALSAMYMAGAAPHRGVEVAANACGNAAIAEATRRAIPRLEAGETMTSVFRSTGYFQPVVLQMLQSGEETGSIDDQLDKVAGFLEQDAETAIKQGVKVFGILIYLAVAAYIGSQVIEFWSSYANGLMGDIDQTM